MDLFIGIDGTGPGDDQVYEDSFGVPRTCLTAVSHVVRLTNLFEPSAKARYLRGPTDKGHETQGLAKGASRFAQLAFEEAMNFCRSGDELAMGPAASNPGERWTGPTFGSRYRQSPTRIFLAGYSRGGAAVIDAAARLEREKIPVHTMFLFDAVDWTPHNLSTDIIPANVGTCYHALRDRAVGSRRWFGNCGTLAAGGVKFEKRYFWGTHGGLGGKPWDESAAARNGQIQEEYFGVPIGTVEVTPAEDRMAAQHVWGWMQGRAKGAMNSPIGRMI